MRRWLVLVAVAAGVLLADQTTKYRAVRDLTALFPRAGAASLGARLRLFYGERAISHLRRPPVEVLPGLCLRYSENPGAAFSLLSGLSRAARRAFFLAVTAVAVALVLTVAVRLRADDRVGLAMLGAVLGGALGNFVDRMTHGYVVDFVFPCLPGGGRLGLPTFNLADVGISVGALWVLVRFAKEIAGHDGSHSEGEDDLPP